MTELPRGWASGSLSDFVTPRGERVSPADFPDLPFIGMDHVEAHTTRIIGSVPARQMKSNASRFCKHDVLYGRLRPYLNKVAQPNFDGLASAEFIVFEGNELIDPGFLRYRLHAYDFVNFASHLNEGDRPRVSFDQIGDFGILVPPPEEQRRIVERIEVLFDEIDRGVESLRYAKKALEIYRHSLLKAAFEGRLTADWRAQNPDKLESPDALLARIREEREARYEAALDEWERAVAEWRKGGENGSKPTKAKRPRAIPVEPMNNGVLGWTTVPLGVAIVDPIYGTSKKCGYGLGASGVLRIPNIRSGRIDPTDLKSADFVKAESAKFSLKEGDILTVRSNGSLSLVGKPAIVQQQHADFLFAGYLIRLRPIPKTLHPKCLVYMMMEPNVRAQIETKAKSTSGVNNISAKELQELNVPICSLAEQTEIVGILDTHLEAAEKLALEIEDNLVRAEAFRQSILKKAFAGELVPQDPDDEPASALLARIRTERAEAPARRRTKPVGVAA